MSEYFLFFKPGWDAVLIYLTTKLAGAFVPAFLLAGAISTFIPKSFIVRYLSANTPPTKSYPVSLFAGGILSVCACGILPLFQTIFQRGAGVGPAMSFLFAGPALNVIAILYTFQLLGNQLGVARLAAVVVMALAFGFLLSALFEKKSPQQGDATVQLASVASNFTAKVILFVVLLTLIILLPLEHIGWGQKGPMVLGLFIFLALVGGYGLERQESIDWMEKSWFLTRNILPKLILGIFIIGCLEPYSNQIMLQHLKDNSLTACFLAALIGSILYVGTIVGVVAVHGLMQMGMPEGPALALLLAGPTISLPSFFVIAGITGHKIASTFALLVLVTSAFCGYFYAQYL